MNARRGLFRFWIVVALAWVLGSAWSLRFELLAHCKSIVEQRIDRAIACDLERIAATEGGPDLEPRGWPIPTQVTAIEWVLTPPIVLFFVGWIGFWVGNGFRRQ
jgi:hypothetical protein